MYYPFFTAYIVVGLALSLWVVYWAIKNGQFGEQQRARFLPLEEEPEEYGKRSSETSPYEIYALGILASAGLLTSAAVLIVALLTGGR